MGKKCFELYECGEIVNGFLGEFDLSKNRFLVLIDRREKSRNGGGSTL